jgi:DNA mismatch repair protein MutS
LETDHLDDRGRPKVPQRTRKAKQHQLALFDGDHHPLLDEIRELNLEQMTPAAALEELQRLRKKLAR